MLMLFEYLLYVLVFVVVQIFVVHHNQMQMDDVLMQLNFVIKNLFDQLMRMLLIMNDDYLHELLIVDL